jgi:hypothetical protein
MEQVVHCWNNMKAGYPPSPLMTVKSGPFMKAIEAA